MALVDKNGKRLTLGDVPTFDVKIVASRREVIWTKER